jgi:hypothetical protein
VLASARRARIELARTAHGNGPATTFERQREFARKFFYCQNVRLSVGRASVSRSSGASKHVPGAAARGFDGLKKALRRSCYFHSVHSRARLAAISL